MSGSKEGEEIRAHAEAEERELASMFANMGMTGATAALAARDVHRDPERAAIVHVTQELGLDPQDKPSPMVAAVSSLLTFSLGAIVPLLPFLLGYPSLLAGLAVGGVGLLVAGGLATRATDAALVARRGCGSSRSARLRPAPRTSWGLAMGVSVG